MIALPMTAQESPPGVVAVRDPRQVARAHAVENQLLGTRLKAFRQALGLRQGAMADYLDISASALSKMERGQQMIPARVFARLVTVFDVPLDAVWYGGGLDGALSAWVQLGARLAPEQRAAVMGACESLLFPPSR